MDGNIGASECATDSNRILHTLSQTYRAASQIPAALHNGRKRVPCQMGRYSPRRGKRNRAKNAAQHRNRFGRGPMRYRKVDSIVQMLPNLARANKESSPSRDVDQANLP